MILQRVWIEGLFCYQERVEFPVTTSKAARNVVVVQGRNGAGKTSFLTALKLLFGGVTDDVRKSTVSGRKLGIDQYLTGDLPRWSGLLNQVTRSRESARHLVGASVEHGGSTIVLERHWRWGKDKTGVLEVARDGARLSPADGKRLAEELLPPDLIDLFFFDGERVQTLAESLERSHRHAVMRLLELEPLRQLIDYLKETEKDLQRGAMDAQARADLVELENEQRSKRQRVSAAVQLFGDMDRRRNEANEAIGRVDRTIERLSDGALSEERGRLRQERESLKEDLAQLRVEVATQLLPLATVVMNPASMADWTRRLTALEEQNGHVAQVDLLRQLGAHLPAHVFDLEPHSDPPLEAAQAHFYKRRLAALLEAYLPPLPAGTRRLPRGQVVAARKAWRRWETLGEQRDSWVQTLAAGRVRRDRLAEVETELSVVGELTAEEAAERRAAEQDRDRLTAEREEAVVERSRAATIRDSLRNELRTLEGRIAKQLENVVQTSAARAKLERLQATRAFIEDLAQVATERWRKRLQEHLDENLDSLVTAPQFHRAQLDEDFSIRFIGTEGEVLGSGGLSAGMKQLVAVAWLWALTATAGRDIPVVIDTPMARLDLDHQTQILTKYLPSAAKQVILLPTDAELTQDRRELLQPHIHAEFTLVRGREAGAARLVSRASESNA